jgi:hypothetical protein
MNPEQTAGGETSGFPPEDTGRRRAPQAIPATTSTTPNGSMPRSSNKASATVHRNVLTGMYAVWRTNERFFGNQLILTLLLSASPLLQQRRQTTLTRGIFKRSLFNFLSEGPGVSESVGFVSQGARIVVVRGACLGALPLLQQNDFRVGEGVNIETLHGN